MIYCVQLGETEVIVELIRQGHQDIGLQPHLEVDANTDWEGNSIYLTREEVELVKQEVIQNWPEEVWADWV